MDTAAAAGAVENKTENTMDLLYRMCDTIDASQNDEESAACYVKILNANADADPRARMLCFQFICRYFAKFAGHASQSLEAAVKLCRDSDESVKQYAFKMLSALTAAASGCQAAGLAEALALLSIVSGDNERTVAETCLTELVYQCPVETMQVLAKLTSHTQGVDYRKTLINYIAKQLPVLRKKAKLTSEVEVAIANGLSAALSVVDGDEFTIVVDVLKALTVCQVDTNRRSLFKAIINEAQLNLPVDVANADRLEQILCCLRAAKQFICDELTTDAVIPLIFSRVFSTMVQPASINADLLSEVMRETVDLVAKCKELAQPDQCIDMLVKMIECRIPQNVDSAKSLKELPDVRMTDLEALMLILYHLSVQYQDMVINKLRPIWTSVLLISQLLQSWSSTTLSAGGGGDSTALGDENRLPKMALKSAENIIMILRIFKFGLTDPKKSIVPSWKNQLSTTNANTLIVNSKAAGDKSKAAANRQQPAGRRPTRNARYLPPVGRYSGKVNFDYGNGNNYQDRRKQFRGRFRGRFQ